MMTKLNQELEELAAMPRDKLVGRWKAAYGNPPPDGARRELLMYAAGWHIQIKRFGGYSGEVRRMLRREVERIKCKRRVTNDSGQHDRDQQAIGLADDRVLTASDGKDAAFAIAPSSRRRKLVPGARLLREWNGQTHVVDVTENGYLYDGATYRSLSAIARRITGAHWSGPRFFGL